MGYYTQVSGEIMIEPPLKWAEFKDSPFYSNDPPYDVQRDVVYRVREEEIETDEGPLTRREADAVVPYTDDRAKFYNIVEQLQELVDAYLTRTFTGFFHGEGEEAGDIWRLAVRNGKAVKVEAKIVWPED